MTPDCKRTAAEALATAGVGYCICRHAVRFHGADGCSRCAELLDRPRLYRGREARGWQWRSPTRQQQRRAG